jgi:hypothetical protein
VVDAAILEYLRDERLPDAAESEDRLDDKIIDDLL